MDINKLTFVVSITYRTDEGDGDLDVEGTCDDAIKELGSLYGKDFNYISIDRFEIYDENDNEVYWEDVLDDIGSYNDDVEGCLEMLEDLKNGENCCKARNIAKIKNRIKELEKEIENAKQELAKLMS